MTMYWVYDLPNAVFGGGTVAVFVIVSVIGMLLTRRFAAWLIGQVPKANELVSYFFSAVGVFYGLTVGLIAVATWQAYSDTDKTVGAEAAALAALYRDVSSYPDPVRQQLQDRLRECTRHVIEVAWPLQRQGQVPVGGTERITEFQKHLYGFEPKTPGQQALHSETLRMFNRLIELRRARLQAVTTGLPTTLWWVLLIGASLTMASGYLFYIPRIQLHLALTVVLAALMGILIFLIAVMDNPFRGEVSIGAEAYDLVYKGLMESAERSR